MRADHDEKMRLLVSLCRELTKRGFPTVMCDARPALSVRAGLTAPRLWISVSPGGEFFECCHRPGGRLAASNPVDAADRITDHVRIHLGG